MEEDAPDRTIVFSAHIFLFDFLDSLTQWNGKSDIVHSEVDRKKSETESERNKAVEEQATATRTAPRQTESKAAEKQQAAIANRRGRI